jgi:hypothetical protein
VEPQPEDFMLGILHVNFASKYLDEYNKLGEEGWEAVAISPNGLMLMKKPKQFKVAHSLSA